MVVHNNTVKLTIMISTFQLKANPCWERIKTKNNFIV